MAFTEQTFTAHSSNSSWANFGAAATGWASQLDAAISALGFSAVTDTYAANGGSTSFANGTTNSALSNPNVIPAGTASISALFGTAFPTTTSQARAGLASTNFKGAWAGGTAYTVGQVVTYTPATGGQQTYMCWATGGVGIAPASAATSTTFWTPYWFSIWKWGGSQTAVYMKIEYGCATGGVTFPEISLQFGTAADGAGDVNASGNFTLTEQICAAAQAYTTTSPTCAVVGDGQNVFGFLMWSATASAGSCIFGAERSISGSNTSPPVYTSLYVTYAACASVAATTAAKQCALGVAATGWTTGTGFNNTSVRNNFWSTLGEIVGAGSSQVVNGTTPLFPVFPIVGWVGNPLSVLATLPEADATEGGGVSATVYGSSHNYLCSKLASFGLVGTGSTSQSSYAVALRTS